MMLDLNAGELVWILYVLEFFEIDLMCSLERRKALRLEKFFCNVRRAKIKSKFSYMIYKLRGFNMTFQKLPREIGVIIFSYLSQKELLTKINKLNKID